MLKQKPNPFVLPMMVILIITLVVFSLLLVRTASKLIFKTLDDTTAIEANSISVAALFDYTRDRDQYWQPTTAVEPFDYTRDRDQYWQPTTAIEPFDYTRDRDQYWAFDIKQAETHGNVHHSSRLRLVGDGIVALFACKTNQWGGLEKDRLAVGKG